MAEYGLREPSYFGRPGRWVAAALPLLALAGGLGVVGYQLARSTRPAVEVMGGFPRVLGPSTPVKVRWTNGHGARRVTVWVEQKGMRTVAYEHVEPARRMWFGPAVGGSGEADAAIRKQDMPSLVPGRATVGVEVQSNDLRAQVTMLTKEIAVVLEKPRVTADGEPVFLRRGGTGLVTFTVGGGWSEAGVRVGEDRFPSWPVKGRPERRICLFTVRPEADERAEAVLYARNEAGDEATSAFRYKLTPVKFRERTLAVGEGLVQKVLNELDPLGEGEPGERFARINSQMRRANDAVLAELGRKSEGKRLWEGTFGLLPKGQAEALFADHRTYTYQKKAVNLEWHLGVDMASVAQAPVPAANRGRVVHAGPLGIYGNCVAIDHGLGVMTVYGHLSELAVKTGEMVGKGQAIGKSGKTGLAGGDHLHLALMVGGVFVDPVEWSYASWMDRTLMPAVAAAE